jgi:hypothetical protein
MSSYPIVLKDKFRTISFACLLRAYESWRGLVYQWAYTENRFSQDALTEDVGYEMAGILLFRTVGIDRSFFPPANAAQLAHYAKQVPEDFRSVLMSGKRSLHPAFANLSATERHQ